MSNIPAGWYPAPDPDRPNTQRWWDGQQWSSQYQEVAPAQPSPAAQQATQHQEPSYAVYSQTPQQSSLDNPAWSQPQASPTKSNTGLVLTLAAIAFTIFVVAPAVVFIFLGINSASTPIAEPENNPPVSEQPQGSEGEEPSTEGQQPGSSSSQGDYSFWDSSRSHPKADSQSEAVYLSMFQKWIDESDWTDESVLSWGYEVCGNVQGITQEQLFSYTYSISASDEDFAQRSGMIGAAIGLFCPEYDSILK